MLDLKEKVAVITGGGGILCGEMARLFASHGAKVALLDLKKEAADKVAQEITKNGGVAIGVEANVLDRDALEKAKDIVEKELGSCDILINGAGGNHPKGTTSNEFLEKEHLDDDSLTTFFDLDPKGIEFVFNLNFLGTLITTQVFSKGMIGKENASIIIEIN